MKIIHTSDLHLESAMTSLSHDKVRERKNELYEALVRMVDEAARIEARLIIIAGDLFDVKTISKKAAERVANLIESHIDIDFLYLPGNHERDGFISKLQNMPNNLFVFGRDWTYFDYGNVTVAGRSELSADMFSELKLDGGRKNIVVLHGAVGEYAGGADTISLSAARGVGIDYIALGHYHSYMKYDIDRRGIAVYSGTPEGRGFDEAGECGFVILETDGEGISHRFCPCAKRTVHIIKVDISGATRQYDIDERCEAALRGVSSLDLVRIVLTGEREMELIPDLAALDRRYAYRYYVFSVKDETRMRIDPDAFARDKSLKGEFIRLVIAKEGLSEDMKDKIIKLGIATLLGEETEI